MIPLPMLGTEPIFCTNLLAFERLYWRGHPLPLGVVRLRWLATAREEGYWYPGKRQRDVLGQESEQLAPRPYQPQGQKRSAA